MDAHHDEVHIDRLFPKCAPNYSQRQVQPQRRKNRAKKHYRRVRSKNNIHIGNLASENLVNDTSSEELCSNNNLNHVEQPDSNLNSHVAERRNSMPDYDKRGVASQPLDVGSPPTDPLQSIFGSEEAVARGLHQHRSTSGSRQVDVDPNACDRLVDSGARLDDDFMVDLATVTRASLTPPGFALRISNNSASDMIEGHSLRTPSSNGIKTHQAELSVPQETSMSPPELPSQPNRLDGQRVKFNDRNLVTVQGDPMASANVLEISDKGLGSPVIASRREQSPLMPIIREDQNEAEFDDVSFELPLASNQNLENLTTPALHHEEAAHFASTERVEESMPTDPVVDFCTQANNLHADKVDLNLDKSQSENHQYDQEHPPDGKSTHEIQLSVEEADNSQQLNLRHHRLPNESSHYSLTRAARDIPDKEDAPRSSNLQFISLSEVESDAEELLTVGRQDSSNIAESTGSSNRAIQKSHPVSISPPSNNRVHNASLHPCLDLARSRLEQANKRDKRPVIFPCLDEGLSSGPESCGEEVDEDEDERAMDADVEADDDEEDDDVDEDDDNTLNSLSKLAIQTSMLNSTSQQRQPQRVGSSRQAQRSETHNGSKTIMDQPVGGQIKLPASAHGVAGQEATSGAKQSSNYSSQEGQWAAATDRTAYSGAKNSSNQQGSENQRSNRTANSIHRTDNRDEVKALSRLSSDTDNETDRLLGSQRGDQMKLAGVEANGNNIIDHQPTNSPSKQGANSKEVLIEGVLFNVRYLGSTQNECEARNDKEERILQAEMAVKQVKDGFRNGSPQSAVEVQLFISTEKIMVLDDKHRKIMMDHSLRTVSYIADIGDAIVLIVKKKTSSNDTANMAKINCHVFESSESHTITKSISQAFQVAYAEILKANGESGSYLPRELDYQEVLAAQEMSTTEIDMFLKYQREVIVPKNEDEILGISIVESGWGSVLPDVVISSLKHDGPAFRCKKLSISDHILTVNGISLVGKPLEECKEILKKTKKQRVARLSVVPGSITVEVKIKRPDTKYQLGFSVQNGVICSLLRGGIAERGGVRVGHRIMSINGTTVVGVPHEKIVSLLASSIGEIRMKTCLTTIYRHMTGEEKPAHV